MPSFTVFGVVLSDFWLTEQTEVPVIFTTGRCFLCFLPEQPTIAGGVVIACKV
jgi:hypothetical protein